jgi:hypothetical protein
MASRHLHRSIGSGLASWHGDSRTDGTEHDTHLINTLHEPSVTPCATRGSRELVLARVVDGQEDVDRHLIARGPGFLSANTKQQLSGLSSLRPARTKHSDQTARDAKADLHSERSSTHLLEPILAPIRHQVARSRLAARCRSRASFAANSATPPSQAAQLHR